MARGGFPKQATSESGERTFSTARRVVTSERLSLKGERIHRLTLAMMRFKIERRGVPTLPNIPRWTLGAYPISADVPEDLPPHMKRWLTDISEITANAASLTSEAYEEEEKEEEEIEAAAGLR